MKAAYQWKCFVYQLWYM